MGVKGKKGSQTPWKDSFTWNILQNPNIMGMSAQVGCMVFWFLFEITWYYVVSVPYSTGFLFNLLSKLFKFGHC